VLLRSHNNNSGLFRRADILVCREKDRQEWLHVEQSAVLPGLIGVYWFQWLDEPVTGRRDGENYNIGFVDVTDRPYWDFIEGVKATHKRLFDVHSGKVPPGSQKAKVQ
jgi:hypothetical protein